MSFSLLDRRRQVQAQIRIVGRPYAREVGGRLTERSIEFHVEPLPDDTWQFTVKIEDEERLRKATRCYQFYGVDKEDKALLHWCDERIGRDDQGQHHRHNAKVVARFDPSRIDSDSREAS